MEIVKQQKKYDEKCPNCKKLFTEHIPAQLLNCALTELEKQKAMLTPLEDLMGRFQRGENLI